MIKIIQGQANIVPVTLTEKVTLDSPVFLFRFVNDETKVEYSCIASDTSYFPLRYNKFSITEKTSPTITERRNGNIELPKAGFYHYYIYEQSSTTNLDYTLATTQVEIGKLKVPGDSRTVESYTPSTTTNKSYTPEVI